MKGGWLAVPSTNIQLSLDVTERHWRRPRKVSEIRGTAEALERC